VAISIPDDARPALIESIKGYFRDQRDEEIGDLQAGFLLDFVLREIGPSVYNQALADTQAYLRNVIGDLDVTLGE
jgi:uncharacterized protein (DUF2164 family)